MPEWMKMILKEFIGSNWSAFERYCKELGVDPEEIYAELEI